MFAVTYSTQAILPEIGRTFGVSPAEAGLSISAGGLVGRIGVALLADAVGWRWAIGLLAALPLVAAVVMQRSLVDIPGSTARGETFRGIRRQLRNASLLRATVTGTAFFFTFVGCF